MMNLGSPIAVLAYVTGNLSQFSKFCALGLRNIEDIRRTEPDYYGHILPRNVFLGFLGFADGLPMAERRLVLAGQGEIYGPMFDEKVTHAAWKSKPSWHVIATKDHTLSPAMEEAGAKKAGGIAISIPTCHVALLQEPEKVADVITEAAKGQPRLRPSNSLADRRILDIALGLPQIPATDTVAR
jgi:hypothetical protein